MWLVLSALLIQSASLAYGLVYFEQSGITSVIPAFALNLPFNGGSRALADAEGYSLRIMRSSPILRPVASGQ